MQNKSLVIEANQVSSSFLLTSIGENKSRNRYSYKLSIEAPAYKSFTILSNLQKIQTSWVWGVFYAVQTTKKNLIS